MKLSPVVLDGQVEKELLLEGRLEVRVDLVEDVVASLSGSLTDDTRLLEQVCKWLILLSKVIHTTLSFWIT